MKLKTRLIGCAMLSSAAVLVTGCAALGLGGSADERWVEYRSWTKVTDGQTGDPTKFIGNVHRGPEGYRNVFVNTTGLATVNDSSEGRVFPAGSVLVKEQYKSEADWQAGKGAGVTVSVKADDGSWLWADSLTGSAKANAFCAGCHGIAAKHDAMFTGGGYE